MGTIVYSPEGRFCQITRHIQNIPDGPGGFGKVGNDRKLEYFCLKTTLVFNNDGNASQ